MKHLIIGIALLLAACSSPPNPELQARDSVHQLNSFFGTCSVVAIKEGVAVTAKHCTAIATAGAVIVDGKPYPVAATHPTDGKDLLTIDVPGLPCPCATPTTVNVDPLEDVILVGFPYGIAKLSVHVVAQGNADVQMGEIVKSRFLMATAGCGPGCSGGGAFVVRDGKPVLIGIISAGREGVLTLITEL